MCWFASTSCILVLILIMSMPLQGRRSDPSPSTPVISLKPPLLTDPRGRIQYKTTYACEGKQLDLSCDEGRMIHLVRANYGRFSLSICNPSGQLDLSVNCMSFKSFLIMQDRCSQVSNCSVVVSSKIFGDPCPGTSKYLEVQYHCVHPNTDPVSVMTMMSPTSTSASSSSPSPIFPSTTKKTVDGESKDDMESKIPLKGNTDLVGIKAPYEVVNVTSTSVVSTMAVTPTSPPISTSSSRSVEGISARQPHSHSSHAHRIGMNTNSHRNHHPLSPSFNPSMPDILGQPIPPRPELSIPPWLESDPTLSPPGRDQGIEIFSSGGSLDAASGIKPFLNHHSIPDGSDQTQEDSNPSNTPAEEEEDDMILMAVALFFAVFFLVMGTFGLLYCLIRSDSFRCRKFARQIPFIHCLFGPDSLGNSDLDSSVEKVSSVVHSTAYGSTGMMMSTNSLHHSHGNFVPIVGTRVPTQITNTDSPNHSKFLTLASGGQQNPQQASPVYPQGINWYQTRKGNSATNSYMTSNLRFMTRTGQENQDNLHNNNSDAVTATASVVNPANQILENNTGGVGSMDNLLMTTSQNESTSSASSSNNTASPLQHNNHQVMMITNSLYRNKRNVQSNRSAISHQDQIRRNLISNPWETSHHQVFESVNPRYASRPEILSYSRNGVNGQPLLSMGSHHLLIQGHQNNSHQLGNSDHVYECIDNLPDGHPHPHHQVNNFNTESSSSSPSNNIQRRIQTDQPRILNV